MYCSIKTYNYWHFVRLFSSHYQNINISFLCTLLNPFKVLARNPQINQLSYQGK
jgi:hypothetical protein